MPQPSNWAFPADLQPNPDEFGFDLDAALDSVVLLRAEIPEDAFTAQILGTERAGNGVVIRNDGLLLTIGYLITEASSVWITTNRGAVLPGHALAYDQATGFGLVQPLGKLDLPPLPRGSAEPCKVGDDVVVAGHGGRAHALSAQIIAKREFAGYWEYVLDQAVFTAPAHPQWGGAALIGRDGRLLAIGSLLVQEQIGKDTIQGNMMVPIDLLEPILDDMTTLGQARRAPRPWLGMYTSEIEGRLVVAGLAPGAPAERAAVRVGDQVVEIAGEPVTGLADMLRKVWRLGSAGTEVPLAVTRKGEIVRLQVRSADRQDYFKKPHLH
jgi:S1-C subfamily serine protease